jgi:predicted nucleic acid-binding protein
MIICDTSGLMAAYGHESSREDLVLQVLEAEERSWYLPRWLEWLPGGRPRHMAP